MPRRSWSRPATLSFVALCLCACVATPNANADEIAAGRVFHDANGNGLCDKGETGIPNVGVSNGSQVTLTDSDGRYALPVTDDAIVFVIKPRNWMTPIDRWNIPRFYHIHKPAGSPSSLQYAGVKPTGALPPQINFPLTPHPEPEKFRIVAFGDPQVRDSRDVDYFAHDVVAELIGEEAAFGVSLGDIAYNRLDVYDRYNAVISTLGMPWYNVLGNHDINFDVQSDALSDETWERVFGPPTYSFNWGPVHFVIIDDVMYDGHKSEGRYHSELGRCLTFIENDLKRVPQDQLVVLLMHIPIVETIDRDKLFALLKDRPHTFSMSAHWHAQKHFFLGDESGWKGKNPHHHLVHATACGAWWGGAPDEFGLPHTTMRDGAPNGYSFITFDGADYAIRFKAARRPADDQLSIFAPDTVEQSNLADTPVVVNVYAGSERSVVEMRIGDKGKWTPMRHVELFDPYYATVVASQSSPNPPNGRRLSDPVKSPHIWAASMPIGLPTGTHVIQIQTRDMFGRRYEGRRIIHIK